MSEALERLEELVGEWEFPYLEFHVSTKSEEPFAGLLLVEARRGCKVVLAHSVSERAVLDGYIGREIESILRKMVYTWAVSWLKKGDENARD